jgi:hypothetical protein
MNKFNRILLASGLAATASLVANSSAFAGTTGKVDLSGTVPSSLEITVTPLTAAASLDLSPGNRNTKIATITGASTNSPNGLFITLTSSNSYRLVSGNNSISFATRSAAGATASVFTHDVGTSGFVLQQTTSTSPGGAPDSSIFISYNVPTGQAPGTYVGSITFTASDR